MKKNPSKTQLPEGLYQTFIDKDKKKVGLADLLSSTDWWEHKKGKSKVTILTHKGMQKIADRAGISKKVDYQVLISPTAMNNYQLSINATVYRGDEVANELGEVNRASLTGKGKRNPTNMAQKRAYDRAVMRLLGISGVLSEDELVDETDDNQMEHLSIEQQKKIAPIVTKIIKAKTVADLKEVTTIMKASKANYQEDELSYLRKSWNKRNGEINEQF